VTGQELFISSAAVPSCIMCSRLVYSIMPGCIQKFPDWPPGTRELKMVQLSAKRCSCIAILWVSLVSFATITLCVTSQRVFIIVVISLSTQSGDFWIHPRIATCTYYVLVLFVPTGT
jgi:hypothetical protein